MEHGASLAAFGPCPHATNPSSITLASAWMIRGPLLQGLSLLNLHVCLLTRSSYEAKADAHVYLVTGRG